MNSIQMGRKSSLGLEGLIVFSFIMFWLLLYLSSSPDERSLCLTVLEILYLIFRQSSPEDLVSSCPNGSSQQLTARSTESDLLANLIEKEMKQKKQTIRSLGSRHSRFGGTYEVFSDKSLSEKNRIHHAPLASVNSFSYDTNKVPRRKAKKFRPIEDDPSSRASISSVRRALGELALGILEHSYNPFMKSVRGRLLHDTSSSFEDHYDTYYLWAIQFFMEFNRLYSFRLDLVRETLDVSIFTYLVKQVYCYQESMILAKDESEKWGRRLHRCVSALRELLNYLQAMQCSEQSVYRENARILQTNIFYMSEFREMFPSMLKEYKSSVQSRSYLATLVDSLHLFLRLLEKFTQASSLMVQKKGRAKKKKVLYKRKIRIDEPTREQLEIEWDKMQYELLRLLEAESGEIDQLEIEGLFDATRQDYEEEQKQEALSRTQACLRRGDMERSVATLRAAREIWPRDDFGPRDSTCIDELKRLQDIYLRPIISHTNVSDSEVLPDDEEFEENVPEQKREGEFDLFIYSLKFCHQKIIAAFCFLLSQYSFNTDFTNHALVKMLHRICYKCKKFPLLYQISIFSVFQFILDESNMSRYRELKLFAIHVLNRFFIAVRQNPCLFVEILFWKSQDDCVDIELGYGTVASMRDSKVSQRLWSEEDTTQLSSLWKQYKGCDRALSEIAAEMTSKTERQIKKKLISSGIAEKTDFAKVQTRKKREWSEEEEERLRELYSVYGEQEDALQSIASHFPGRSEKEVNTIMKKLGIGGVKTTEENSENCLLSKSKPKRVKKKKHMSAHPPVGTISKSARTISNNLNLRKAIVLYESVHADEQLLPALKWLDRSLRGEAVDRETDPVWDTVPLVPNSLELGRALESEVFLDLMRALSMAEPDTGQMFWRIPSEMTPKELITCADLLSGELPELHNEADITEPLEEVHVSESPDSDLSEYENSSDSSQLSAEDPPSVPTILNTNSVKQKRPALAKLLEKTKSTAQKKVNTFKTKEFLSDSDLSDGEFITSNQVESLHEILVPSPPISKMKPSIKRLYNSDSGSDTADRLETSQPLHYKFQRLSARMSEDSDEEPDHLLREEDTGGVRGKRARLDSEDSEDGVSFQKEERFNLKKVRYIQESDDDDGD